MIKKDLITPTKSTKNRDIKIAICGNACAGKTMMVDILIRKIRSSNIKC